MSDQAPRLKNEKDERLRVAIVNYLSEEGTYLCATYPPGSPDFEMGADFRRQASLLQMWPHEFYRQSLEGWGAIMCGFLVPPDDDPVWRRIFGDHHTNRIP